MTIAVFWLIFSVCVALAAGKRGRDAVTWFILAVLLSPLVAGLVLLALPDRRLQSPPAERGDDATVDDRVLKRNVARAQRRERR